MRSASLFLFLALASFGDAFVVTARKSAVTGRLYDVSVSSSNDDDGDWKVEVDLPPTSSGKKAFITIKPILDVPSEIVQVRYKVPFGLNVEPQKSLAVCTKDGEGGERVGDVLRYTSQWTLGLPEGDGLVNSAAAFAGGLSWTCTMFNVMKAQAWEQVVEALVSNVDTKTDEVVLIFERPLP